MQEMHYKRQLVKTHKMKVVFLLAIVVTIILTIVFILRANRERVFKWLSLHRMKLRVNSARVAIKDADKNKEETGRKNMVVYNNASQAYEPIQKRLLKYVAKKQKNKSNKAMTPGRKRMMRGKKKRVFINNDGVKGLEKNSIYVTN